MSSGVILPQGAGSVSQSALENQIVELRFHPISLPGQLDLAVNCWGALEGNESLDVGGIEVVADSPSDLVITGVDAPDEQVEVGKVLYPANKTIVFRCSSIGTIGDKFIDVKVDGDSGTILWYRTVILVQTFMNIQDP